MITFIKIVDSLSVYFLHDQKASPAFPSWIKVQPGALVFSGVRLDA